MTEENKLHYQLVVGTIIFREKGKEAVASLTLNAIVNSKTRLIPVKLLGRSQQILQANFTKKMDGTEVEILDVVLLNFTYLGEMTEEEFVKPPADTELKEKAV